MLIFCLYIYYHNYNNGLSLFTFVKVKRELPYIASYSYLTHLHDHMDAQSIASYLVYVHLYVALS